jgi:acetyl-CoA decarbonylase/synthase, CODH/ACS complex subunit delta
MAVPAIEEKWAGQVTEVVLGATEADGGTRSHTVTVGGAKGMPYVGGVDTMGHRPKIVMDVMDMPHPAWPATLSQQYEGVLDDPAAWARKCVDEFGADLICFQLVGVHPDYGKTSPDQAVEIADTIRKAVGCPLIVWGCGDDAVDNEVLPKISQALAGERVIIGPVDRDNYRTLTAIAQADGHFLLSLAPIDINLAKQTNILVTDMGFPLERIIMFQTTGGLGYGMDYVYSIQERQRQAALTQDKLMAQPCIADIGREAWKPKEARATAEDFPAWGDETQRGPAWEAATASTLLQSCVDMARIWHPTAVAAVKELIDQMWSDG